MRPYVLMAVFAATANAATFTYANFSSIAGLTLNGNAAQVVNALRLVPNLQSQSGSAFLSNAINLSNLTAFESQFEFNISTPQDDPTDGFTFLIQSVGANALGSGGQGSGYAGVSPSVAILFRDRNPSFISEVTNGVDPLPSVPPGATSIVQSAIYNRNEFAWIVYDTASTTLNVFLDSTNVKPTAAIYSTTIDLSAALGSQAYFGFSAGTGAASGNNDILSWQLTTAPEPGTLGLIFTTLSCFACVKVFKSR